MNHDPSDRGVEVFMSSAAQAPGLQTLWCELESRADASFFLSWSWIGSWLASLPSRVEVQVIRAEQRGQVVGLALLVVTRLQRLRIPLGRAAHLHCTGDPEYDGLTIEHNGLLLDRAIAKSAQSAMLRFMCDPKRYWRSVSLPGLTGAQAIGAEMLPPRVAMDALERHCAVVPLQPVRDRDGDYLGLLGTRRRAHIRRSMRGCAERGPLHLSVAKDATTAMAFFEDLLTLHRKRRADLGSRSGFDTPFARDFHCRLIKTCLPRGEVQLVRVHAGEDDIGYLYNFVHRGRVSFYQSGFAFGSIDHRYSPGLVTVALAIEHNARLGHDCFDFLAGDAQYKRALATHSEPMWWVNLNRDCLTLRAENALLAVGRSSRNWLRKRLASGADDPSVLPLNVRARDNAAE